MKTIIKTFANLNIVFGIVLILSPIMYLLAINLFPIKSEAIQNFDPIEETEIISKDPFEGTNLLDPYAKAKNFKDPFSLTNIENQSLTQKLKFNVPENTVADIGTLIKIPSIGLDTKIYETQNVELGLNQGVWRDPQHGTPDDNSQPIVLAAHRWGEDSLSWDYRYQNLFTRFDNLNADDLIYITWNGVEYKYKVTFKEENTSVTRLADLVMYTCVYYHSPERIIVYAELVY